ncbi:hypothetical membrane protein [Thermococcus kodakarensis KOD1]|uniref:Hypothetical membrane protein n=1 Tax=Thermococcus kodakarensis (strain ATCC BAA-918 / JCM 12380 / KOD1) TaxID=69014 RepID=Q5JGW0_THEKO|nr:hypothetical protein [Thermococcus kodakarensis]WCN27341.1 hypothetical protein POG15_06920 [Thermococcus kodakarensis]WCN29630.1 hypothetical protein POG21_06915 [Thermococcus kodakarensis]BAD85551.1 hypothetical membrane protein [Thermococcus kodakarensis KOD1]
MAEDKVDFEIPETPKESPKAVDRELLETLNKAIKAVERLGDRYFDVREKDITSRKELELEKYRYWSRTVITLSILAITLISGVLYLGNEKVLSNEGVSFLLGTIAGYLFSILGGLISGGVVREKRAEE